VLDITPAIDSDELSVKMAKTTDTALAAGIAKDGYVDPKAG